MIRSKEKGTISKMLRHSCPPAWAETLGPLGPSAQMRSSAGMEQLEESAMLVASLSSQWVLWQHSEQHNLSAKYLIKTTLQTTVFHITASRTRYKYKSFFLQSFAKPICRILSFARVCLLTPRGTRSRNDLYT